MESPFRNIASIAEVASGGEDVSRALIDLLEPFRDAPLPFRHLATNIGQCASLLKCTVHLFQRHQGILRPELAAIVSDVNGHFGIIQETVKRWIKAPRGRWRRIKWLFWSGRVTDFIRRLQALTACLYVVVDVATIAIDKSQEVATWQLILRRSHALRSIEDARVETQALQRAPTEPVEVPRPYRGLLTLGETGRDIAEWMSTVLSAPAVPLKGAAGGPPPMGIIKYERSRYAFSPTSRPNPDFDAESPRLMFSHDSICLAALSRLGLQYTIEDSEDGQESGRKVLVQIDKSMKDFEVDLIVSTSQVMGAIPSPEWKPITSPWMRLPPDEALGRLLKSCTILSEGDVDSLLLEDSPALSTAVTINGDHANGAGANHHEPFRFALDAEGDEFNREEFERSESVRDWAVHPPVQGMGNAKWESRSRLSDGNLTGQGHHFPVMPSQQQNQLMLSAAPLPTLHESPPTGRRVSYPLGMDPAWIQEFQERVDLREKVKDLEQKLQYSKDEAKVSVMELENRLDDSKKTELDLSTRLAQEQETQMRFEKELKTMSIERAQLDSSRQQAKTKLEELNAQIGEYKEEIARLRGEMSALETLSTKADKSEETQRGMDTYKKELDRWKLEMMNQQSTLDQQWRAVSDRKVAELRDTVMKELSGLRTMEDELVKAQHTREKLALEHRISNLKKAKEVDEAKIEELELKKEIHDAKVDSMKEEAALCQRKYEGEIQSLADKIKKLKKKKTKAQLELQWLKESQTERIKAEKEAARAAAIMEFRETLHLKAKEAVQKEMDEAAEKQARLDAARQKLEADAAAEMERAATEIESSLSSSSIDVMSFVVEDDDDDESGGVDWPDNKTETDDGPGALGAEYQQDGTREAADNCDGGSVRNEIPEVDPRAPSTKGKCPVPRVEDFLVTSESGNDSGYKSLVWTVSQPWKGMREIEAPAFEGVSPLYIRGNNLGQTLYCGANPIHIRELDETYTLDGEQEYLTISKLYIDPQVLEQYGIEYVELGDGYLSLDPAIGTSDIEKLFHQSYTRREIEAYKLLKKAYNTSVVGEQEEPYAEEEAVEDEQEQDEQEEDEQDDVNDEEAEKEARALAGTCRAS
ncbi:hypothetical protein MKZ38_008321 [Zalerion maritima]|uniref:Uncharacterized protein n=1 Tax=Zalerion maritima TaxID=339359 RepID=A0AAD5RGU8_9PEZI|nr:hypothetical protein MKZ38_008321 [Zalerion maritima]